MHVGWSFLFYPDAYRTSSASRVIQAPIGISNEGNSCYFNAVCQALASSEGIINAIQTEQHTQSCNSIDHCCLRCMVENFLLTLRTGTSLEEITSLARTLFTAFPQYGLKFSPYSQADAQEMLETLFKVLQTPIVRCVVQDSVRCYNCQFQSITMQSLSCLPLEIPMTAPSRSNCLTKEGLQPEYDIYACLSSFFR